MVSLLTWTYHNKSVVVELIIIVAGCQGWSTAVTLKYKKGGLFLFVKSQPTEDEDHISQLVPPLKVFDDLWGLSGYTYIREFASMHFNPSRASRKGILPRFGNILGGHRTLPVICRTELDMRCQPIFC